MAINVCKLYMEYIRGNDQLDARRRAVQEDDINLTGVKLEVVKTEWRDEFTPAKSEVCSTVNLAGSGATAFVNTKNKNSATVILNKGIIQGLNNRTFQLPLNPNKLPSKKDLTEAFGEYLDVDFSRKESEHQPKRPIIGAGLVKQLDSRGATAKVCTEPKKYTGHFVCTVIMKGKCLGNGSEQQIGDVISRMKPKNPDLKALSVIQRKGKNVVQFEIKGDLVCTWDVNERMELKQN